MPQPAAVFYAWSWDGSQGMGSERSISFGDGDHDAVSTGSGSDRVMDLANSAVPPIETRSLPLPVLTPSLTKRKYREVRSRHFEVRVQDVSRPFRVRRPTQLDPGGLRFAPTSGYFLATLRVAARREFVKFLLTNKAQGNGSVLCSAAGVTS